MQHKHFAVIVLTQLMLISVLAGCSSSEEQQAMYRDRAQEQYAAGDL